MDKPMDIDLGRRKTMKLLAAGSAAAASGFLGDGVSASAAPVQAGAAASRGPVRIHPNWFYFTDDSGKAIMFTGSHTWARRVEKRAWLYDGWDLEKYKKYLDFLQHWNHNYIRLWMWEHEGAVDIWEKGADGKYDLSKLNQAYFDLQRSFVAETQARGLYAGVMLFQGWSGSFEPSRPNWPMHPMHKDRNVNGIDADPDSRGVGHLLHVLTNPEIVRIWEAYVRKMIDTLNGFDNMIWEIGNETILDSIPWKIHMVQFIRDYEKSKPKQHLILDGTGNGIGNNSVYRTNPDVFSPCVVTKWGNLDDPYIGNPPIPSAKFGKPIVLDNDHLGNHFLRYTPLNQRNWTWRSFTRANHPIHMDCYDVFWDNAAPTPNHPIPGVSTHPGYDPQRKSLGDVQIYANKMDLGRMIPTDDPAVCSTTFCLAHPGREYLAYQPLVTGDITLNLPAGSYDVETFNAADSTKQTSTIQWSGGPRTFARPSHAGEDWVLYVKARA